MDLALKKALSNSNFIVGFKGTGIWPLNLERMEKNMGPSKTIPSLPSEKLLEDEILEDDLSKGGENGKHFYIEDEGEEVVEGGVEPENTTEISQFLRLPQRMVQVPKVGHEPLVNYSQSQILTSQQHIQNMEDIAYKKSVVAQQRVEKARQNELKKVKRAVDKAFKEDAEVIKVADKEKTELIPKNGRKRIMVG